MYGGRSTGRFRDGAEQHGHTEPPTAVDDDRHADPDPDVQRSAAVARQPGLPPRAERT
jgi:hypothetical protein